LNGIRELLGVNLGWDISCPECRRDFPQVFQENAAILPLLGLDRFLRSPYLIVTHLSSINFTLYSLAAESVVK
jgi:hypothetical protein